MLGQIGVNKGLKFHIYLEKDIKSWNFAKVSPGKKLADEVNNCLSPYKWLLKVDITWR